MLQFQPGYLGNLITELQENRFCGVAYIDSSSHFNEQKRDKLLVFLNGEITYGGAYVPDPNSFSKALAHHFKLPLINEAFKLAKKKMGDQASIRKYLELYVQLSLLSWQDMELFIRNHIIVMLEQIVPCAGTLKLNSSISCDLSYGTDRHGFIWNQLHGDLMQRQQAWNSLAPAIPSMDAVPQCMDSVQHTITNPSIQQHLKLLVDGQRSLIDIAHQVKQDPLELAQTYLHFVQKGWVMFKQPGYVPDSHRAVISEPVRSTILSVDDSRVVQTMIKRTIGDRYNILLANNAVDALNLLNIQNVELMLLDVTMPDIDGLEFCRTIRGIHKFRALPIIMLTAKEGMLNKLKGQIAGSTHYLTKPINRQILLEVIQKYIPYPTIV